MVLRDGAMSLTVVEENPFGFFLTMANNTESIHHPEVAAVPYHNVIITQGLETTSHLPLLFRTQEVDQFLGWSQLTELETIEEAPAQDWVEEEIDCFRGWLDR